MDIAGLALAIPPLLAQCGKLVKLCYDAQTRYRNAPSSLAGIITECNAVTYNISEIQYLSVQELGYLSEQRRDLFRQQINRLALACISTLSKIEHNLESFRDSADDEGIIIGPLRRVGRNDRMRFAWNEDEVTELLERLQGYEINLMLSLSLLKM
jgi:hypothetical protein